MKVFMIGFGNVGRAFAKVLLQYGQRIEGEHGLRVDIVGVVTRRNGILLDDQGLDLVDLGNTR